jgi:hypothetical protein
MVSNCGLEKLDNALSDAWVRSTDQPAKGYGSWSVAQGVDKYDQLRV